MSEGSGAHEFTTPEQHIESAKMRAKAAREIIQKNRVLQKIQQSHKNIAQRAA